MTAHSATGPTTPPTTARQALAWATTWILPLVLGTAVVFAYLFMIVPATDRPWYMPPTPKPGKSVIFRSMNHVHQVSDEATAKAERKARLEERRRAAASAEGADPPGSSDPKRPTPTTKIDAAVDPAAGLNPATGPGTASGAKPEADPDPELDPTIADVAVTGEPLSSPRSRADLNALWKDYGDAPLEGEPVDERWAQAQKSLHYQLFALTRDAAFDGAPDGPVVSLRDVTCRSIRCELVLTSAYHHELTILADALAELRKDRASLWRGFDRGAIQRLPAPSGDGSIYELRLIVGCAGDLSSPADISLRKRKLLPKNQMSPTGATHG